MITTQKQVLGLVTIGQSPRDDVMPQLLPFLPGDVAVQQMGALDGLTRDQIQALAPGPDDYVLHTRLRDGSPVTIGREPIVSRVQACIDELEEAGANPILLLCTGQFPELRSQGLLVEPDHLLVHLVCGLKVRRLGVMVPLASQIGELTEKWAAIEADVSFAAASPYADQAEVAHAARMLGGMELDLVVMDCIGYTRLHKRAVSQATRRPVILASSAVGRVVGEMLDGGDH
ncbi:MAG: AroM family protein [Anaerolineae bacterium]